VAVGVAAFALGPASAVRIGAVYLGFEESLSAPRHVHAPDEFAGKNTCSWPIWGRWSGYCAASASAHTRADNPENWRTPRTRFNRQEPAMARRPHSTSRATIGTKRATRAPVPFQRKNSLPCRSRSRCVRLCFFKCRGRCLKNLNPPRRSYGCSNAFTRPRPSGPAGLTLRHGACRQSAWRTPCAA
jgi:hypothetical protein